LDPEDDFVSRINARGVNLPGFATKMGPWKKVGEMFFDPPLQDYLHIIVKLPETGEFE
jgi:hypothetical protein